MSVAELALAALVVTAGAAVQGAVGFGAGLMAAPLLLLINPSFIPGPMVVAGLVMNLGSLRADPRRADWTGARWAMAGLLPGALVAAAALATFDGDDLTLLSGAAILAAVAVSATGLHPPLRRRTFLAAGFFSGYMTGTAAVGGPPLALGYQRAPATTMRATLPVIFVAGGVITLVTLVAGGHLSTSDAVTGLVLAPGAIAGYHLTRRMTAEFDGRGLRTAVLVLSGASAAAAIARVLI